MLGCRALTPALLIAALISAAEASAAPPRKSKSARLGDVRATVNYRQPNSFSARDVRLRVVGGGAVVYDRPVRGTELPTGLRIRDLDADGLPEVLLDLYSGGAHCCASTLFVGYDAASGAYRARRHVWGNPGYSLRDLDRDARPELVSADDRFAYRFTAYFASFVPVRIWRYEGGRMTDVTRRHRAVVARDAAMLWREYVRLRRQRDVDLRGVLAAFLADKYLLGQQRDGWRRLNAALRRGELRGFGAPWPAGARYLRALRAFLARAGYAR